MNGGIIICEGTGYTEGNTESYEANAVTGSEWKGGANSKWSDMEQVAITEDMVSEGHYNIDQYVDIMITKDGLVVLKRFESELYDECIAYVKSQIQKCMVSNKVLKATIYAKSEADYGKVTIKCLNNEFVMLSINCYTCNNSVHTSPRIGVNDIELIGNVLRSMMGIVRIQCTIDDFEESNICVIKPNNERMPFNLINYTADKIHREVVIQNSITKKDNKNMYTFKNMGRKGYSTLRHSVQERKFEPIIPQLRKSEPIYSIAVYDVETITIIENGLKVLKPIIISISWSSVEIFDDTKVASNTHTFVYSEAKYGHIGDGKYDIFIVTSFKLLLGIYNEFNKNLAREIELNVVKEYKKDMKKINKSNSLTSGIPIVNKVKPKKESGHTIEQKVRRGSVVLSHNGNKFDNLILMKAIYKVFDIDKTLDLKVEKIIERDGDIQSFSLNNYRFVDSYLLTNMSLSSLSELYGMKKRDYDFTRINPEMLMDIDKVQVLQEYCETDCYIRLKSIWKFNKLGKEDTTIHLISCSTVSQYAFSVYRKIYIRKDSISNSMKDSKVSKFISKAYKGGLVEVYRPYSSNTVQYDISSSYGNVIKNHIIPGGIGKYGKDFIGDGKTLDTFVGFVKVKVKVESKNNLHPVLSIQWENLNEDMLIEQEAYSHWRGKEVIGDVKKIGNGLIRCTGTFITYVYSEELKYAISQNNVIVEEWIDYVEYSGDTSLFKKYIDFYYDMKSSGNVAGVSFAKLILNALYGRLAINEIINITFIICDEHIEIWDHILTIKSKRRRSSNHHIITGEYRDKSVLINTNYTSKEVKDVLNKYKATQEVKTVIVAKHVASAVTAIARVELHKICILAYNNSYDKRKAISYSDTDSLVTKYKYLRRGTGLGEYKIEYRAAYTLVLGCKVYFHFDSDKKLIKITLKGVPKYAIKEHYDKLTYKEIEKLIYNKGHKYVFNFKKTIKKIVDYSFHADIPIIYTIQLSSYKRVYTYIKGKWNGTVPYQIIIHIEKNIEYNSLFKNYRSESVINTDRLIYVDKLGVDLGEKFLAMYDIKGTRHEYQFEFNVKPRDIIIIIFKFLDSQVDNYNILYRIIVEVEGENIEVNLLEKEYKTIIPNCHFTPKTRHINTSIARYHREKFISKYESVNIKSLILVVVVVNDSNKEIFINNQIPILYGIINNYMKMSDKIVHSSN